MRLKGKVIVVVGATGGIGSVLSREFHHEDATVVLAARTKEKLETLAEELGEERTLVVPTDASNASSVWSLFNTAELRFRHIDAVVISVGTWDRLSVDNPLTEAVKLIDRHYRGIFLPSFLVGITAQRFIKGHNGWIINISSHAAVRPDLKGNLSYGPMKAAARHFMLALWNELRGTGLRVTDIQPAIVNTPDNARLLDTEEKRTEAVQPEEIAEWIMDQFPFREVVTEKLFDSKIVV